MMSLLGLAVITIVVGMIFVLRGLSLAEKMSSWEAGIYRSKIITHPNKLLAQLGSTIGDIVAKSNVKTSDIVFATLFSGLVLGASPSLQRQILTIMTDMVI